MRYHNITKDDMLNGDGLRVVLWVSGCSHHCPECQNPVTWDPEEGLLFGEKEKEELFTELAKPYISGITFSGGDPLHAANEAEILALAKEIRSRFPGKDDLDVYRLRLGICENAGGRTLDRCPRRRPI